MREGVDEVCIADGWTQKPDLPRGTYEDWMRTHKGWRRNNEDCTRADADNAVLTRTARGHMRTCKEGRGNNEEFTQADADQ
jgi:hypothetical protein